MVDVQHRQKLVALASGIPTTANTKAQQSNELPGMNDYWMLEDGKYHVPQVSIAHCHI